MTIPEAIKWYEDKLKVNEIFGLFGPQHEAAKLALAALKAQLSENRGQWQGEGDGYADGEIVYDVWRCSECDHVIDDGTDDPKLLPNYCPNCGAKMKEGADGC